MMSDSPLSAVPASVSAAPSLLLICLCAQWCGVCRDYRSRFEQVQAQYPQAQCLWLDVEDDAELLEPLDVENFPTVLLAVDGEARFFGPLTPQRETLERLVRVHLERPQPPLRDAAVTTVLARIRQAMALG